MITMFPESTCLGAFSNCDGDSVCRLRLSALMDACAWSDADNQCDRQNCLMSVKVLLHLLPD